MDYKIEMKPTYWEVILSSGCYSDYSELHLFFSGNDENEIWNFLCRYVDDINKDEDESDFLSWSVNNPLAMKFGDKKYLSDKYTGDKDINWSDPYDIVDVSIERLNVIYFQK